MRGDSAISKGEKTRQHILKTVAPVFNKKGYAGTSLTDITKATGLTKGAIYGNFGSKEDLALEAFNFNFRWIIQKLNNAVMQESTPLAMLQAITKYYRTYYDMVIQYGGCPIVNIGVDTNYQNPLLFKRVKQIMFRMIDKMEKLIEAGIEAGEIKPTVDAKKYARMIFAQIEGGIFVAVMTHEESCLTNVLDVVDAMIERDMKI